MTKPPTPRHLAGGTRSIALALLLTVTSATQAFAWGGQGHELTGAIAEAMLVDTKAGAHVLEILGAMRLRTAAKWPDCVRSVRRSGDGFAYKAGFADCEELNTPDEVARMVDYAARNWTNCPTAGGRACHATYHYADVAIQRDQYSRDYFGAFPTDIVAAINAAVLVLQDKPAPPPFSIKDKKEALLLLAHFVGDLHQPLHVGSIYLANDGSPFDPDAPPQRDHDAIENNFGTRGGNEIRIRGGDLHSMWDRVPPTWGSEANESFLKAAGAVPPTDAALGELAAAWAGETIRVATAEPFQGLTFGERTGGKWLATVSDADGYRVRVERTQHQQIAKSGARLAELLKRIWPNN